MNKRLPLDPQVTVVIAAWNAQDSILRAIDTALAQDVPVEVVVVDDASDDDTFMRAKARADKEPRLTVLGQSVNQGPSAARNRAISVSSAPWITVLDSDDWMEAGRLNTLLALASKHKADFVADDLWKLEEGAPPSERRAMLGGDRALQHLTAAEFIASNLSSRHGGRREMGFLKPLMSRDFLQRQGLSYDPDIRLGEDYVLYAKALIGGAHFLLTGPAGYVATVRPGSLSGNHPTQAHAALIAADRALLQRRDLDSETRRMIRAHIMEQRKKWAWRKLIDAVREADVLKALQCFWAPPPVSFDLMRRLTREVLLRVSRRIGAE